MAMPPKDDAHPDREWWRTITTRVNELWDWMHAHDAEIGAWWKEQWKCNKDMEATLADHTKQLHALDIRVGALAMKIGLVSALGAILGGAVMSWLLGKF